MSQALFETNGDIGAGADWKREKEIHCNENRYHSCTQTGIPSTDDEGSMPVQPRRDSGICIFAKL